MLGNTFAQTLYEWLSSMQDPYSVGWVKMAGL